MFIGSRSDIFSDSTSDFGHDARPDTIADVKPDAAMTNLLKIKTQAIDITALAPYLGMKLADVKLVQSSADMALAVTALLAADVIGFDTESKPTFIKGEISNGPHLIQLATDDTAFLFQISNNLAPVNTVLKAILESNTVLKVGFGLSDDLKRLDLKLAIKAACVLDLSVALSKGQRNTLGAKSAVAKFFGLRLQKSKKISTTNWANARLSERQILYAADDAHVALRVYRRWLADADATLPA